MPRKNKLWPQEKVDLLLKLNETLPPDVICERMGYHINSVISKLRSLGVPFAPGSLSWKDRQNPPVVHVGWPPGLRFENVTALESRRARAGAEGGRRQVPKVPPYSSAPSSLAW